MAIRVNLKLAGIFTDPNSIGSVPEGALLEAENVIIDSDDVVESRRGFKVYGSTFSEGTAKQLLNYKDTIIRHHSDELAYDLVSSPGTFQAYNELAWIYSNTLTRSGATATFTASRPHKLQLGDTVIISGAEQDEYNGSFTVTNVVSSTVFEYTVSGTPTTPATGNPVLEARTFHINQIDSGNKIRGVEAVNSNFYFTSDSGTKKLDAVQEYVKEIGAPKALDTDLALVDSVTSPIMPQNSQIGYRVLWGYKDANQNLILGAPSNRAVIALTTANLIIPNFNALLNKIDAAAAVNTGTLSETNYFSLLNISTTAGAAQLNAALKSLSNKLELDIGHVNPNPAVYGRTGNITAIPTGTAGSTITVTAANTLSVGDRITLSNTNSFPSADGEYTIVARTAANFNIQIQQAITVAGTSGSWTSGIAQDYPTPLNDLDEAFIDQQSFFDEIVDALLSESLANIDATAQTAADFENSTQGKDVSITFTVPSNITTNYLYQIYRTAASAGSNIDPGDDMGLVYESNPTAAEIKAGLITVTDQTPDEFRGADLYTNPRQEGILQANEQPPFAKDIAIYKNIAFYANTKTRHKKEISLLGVDGLSGTTITIGDVLYTFAASENTTTGQVQVFTTGTPAQNVDDTARSLVRVVNRYSSNTNIYAYYQSGVDDIPGRMLFEARDIDSSTFYIMSNSPTIGSDNFSPSIAPENNAIVSNSIANPTVVSTTTAHGLNTNDQVYIVSSNSTPSLNGLHTVTKLSATTFSVPVNVTVAGTAGYFKKAALAAYSDNEVVKNRVYYSKQDIYEAVPVLNYFNVGSGDKEILRIVPLRDSLFILKDDGIYRVTGETSASLVSSLFDTSIEVKGADTVVVGNNQIYGFSNQGVCTISDTGVQIISRPVEDQLLKLAPNSNVPATSFAVFYQTDRKYILWLANSGSDTVSKKAWVYNNVTQAWTNWIQSKTCALVNTANDKLYLGASDINAVEIERKSFDRTDFADREFSLNVTEYVANTKTITLSSIANVSVGDVLVQTLIHNNNYGSYEYEVESKVLSVDAIKSKVIVNTIYDYATGPITLYKAYQCKITWAPEDAGNEGEIKQFREATLRFKKSRISSPVMGFSSDLQSGLQEIELIGPGLGNWGYFPWGGVPWGGDSTQRGFRTYVPLSKQRCSLLNCQFKHFVAREDWQLEGLSLVVETLSSRINR